MNLLNPIPNPLRHIFPTGKRCCLFGFFYKQLTPTEYSIIQNPESKIQNFKKKSPSLTTPFKESH